MHARSMGYALVALSLGIVSPAPATTATIAPSASCAQGLYIIDGTNSGPEQNNLMSHLYQWASARPGGCALVKRYYSGISQWLGDGVDWIVADAVRDICSDAVGAPDGTMPVRIIGLIGFSRGAVAAVTVANRVRQGGCGRPLPAQIAFVGLIDPVRTLVSHLDGTLAPGVPRTIQIVKEQYFSVMPEHLALRTFLIRNVPAVVVPGIGHGDMNCIKPVSAPVEARITAEAEQAGFAFGPHVRRGQCVAGPGSMRRFVTKLSPGVLR